MNLQKRIFRVNMTMLVLSLIAMLGVSIYVVNSIYRNQGTRQSTSQASLENFSGTDYSSLADELAKSGVQLYAESNGEVVFSYFKDDSEDLSTISISATTHTSYVDGDIVISRKVATDGQM